MDESSSMDIKMKLPRQLYAWTTKCGTSIRVCDMDDNHLENTINFLERLAKKRKDAILLNAYREHFEYVYEEHVDPEVVPYFVDEIMRLRRQDISAFLDNSEAYMSMFVERERRKRIREKLAPLIERNGASQTYSNYAEADAKKEDGLMYYYLNCDS